MAERASRDQWRQRVRSWRQSGKSADDFAAEIGVKQSTLRWWAWNLKDNVKPAAASRERGVKRKRRAVSAPSEPVSFVALQSAAGEPEPDAEVAVEVSLSNGHRLRVGHGSDAIMVERVLGALLEER